MKVAELITTSLDVAVFMSALEARGTSAEGAGIEAGIEAGIGTTIGRCVDGTTETDTTEESRPRDVVASTNATEVDDAVAIGGGNEGEGDDTAALPE